MRNRVRPRIDVVNCTTQFLSESNILYCTELVQYFFMSQTIETHGEKAAFVTANNKIGVVELARGLHRASFQVVSLGGTGKLIESKGVPVVTSEEFIVPVGPELKNLDNRTRREVVGTMLGHCMSLNPEQRAAADLSPIDFAYINLMPTRTTTDEERPEANRMTGYRNDKGGAFMILAALEGGIPVLVEPEQIPPYIQALEAGEGSSPVLVTDLQDVARDYVSDYLRTT